MLIVGFCFATVSGYLVGVIGSSNNPISGLTLSTLIIAALLMVALGVSGTERRDRGAGRGRGGLRFERGRRRTAAGFQSRLHPRRHAAQHSDRGTDRRGGGEPGDVFPAAGAAPGQHQHGRHRLRRSRTARAAGRPDGLARAGHRRRRHGVAADRRRHPDGRRDDHDRREEPHAGRDRHVSAARHHLRDFHRRHGSLGHRHAWRAAAA